MEGEGEHEISIAGGGGECLKYCCSIIIYNIVTACGLVLYRVSMLGENSLIAKFADYGAVLQIQIRITDPDPYRTLPHPFSTPSLILIS